MYGLINRSIRDLVLEKYGHSAWEGVLRRSALDVEFFVTHQAYPDEVTLKLIRAVSTETGVEMDAFLRQLGQWWIVETAAKSYGNLLSRLGSSFPEAVKNLPNLHTRVRLIFPELQPPEFDVELTASNRCRVEYRSHRRGLQPFVVGLFEGMGNFWEVSVEVRQVASVEAGAECDVFEVAWQPILKCAQV